MRVDEFRLIESSRDKKQEFSKICRALGGCDLPALLDRVRSQLSSHTFSSREKKVDDQGAEFFSPLAALRALSSVLDYNFILRTRISASTTLTSRHVRSFVKVCETIRLPEDVLQNAHSGRAVRRFYSASLFCKAISKVFAMYLAKLVGPLPEMSPQALEAARQRIQVLLDESKEEEEVREGVEALAELPEAFLDTSVVSKIVVAYKQLTSVLARKKKENSHTRTSSSMMPTLEEVKSRDIRISKLAKKLEETEAERDRLAARVSGVQTDFFLQQVSLMKSQSELGDAKSKIRTLEKNLREIGARKRAKISESDDGRGQSS